MITIDDKKKCMGCNACTSICPKSCITMESDQEGFWYPEVDNNDCIECGLCVKVCPIINKTSVENDPSAYACINSNESIRLESSSGGIFTSISEQIIYNNGIVFGAIFDENFKIIHSYAESKEELRKLRGSKYVQSEIGNTYSQAREFLKQGRQVLFTGTPCQIGGLKSFLQHDYDNLFCIDIICHGVPSPKVFQKYISYQENCSGSKVREISFRRKNYGWKRYSISLLFNNNDIEYLQIFDKDLYMKVFLEDICLRPSCYSCEFKTLHRQSDITLADFWGIEDILPKMNDDRGTSLIFVNSINGQSMLEQIKDKISYKEVDINKAISYNPAAINSVEHNLKRKKFFYELDRLSFDKLVKKYCSDSVMLRTKRRIKSVIYRVVSLFRAN